MTPVWRSLRMRLAALGLLAIYLPALLLFGVLLATETESTVQVVDGVETVRRTEESPSPWVTWTIVGLAPAAAGLAWWWAGRAVRPIERVRAVAEDIEATDLGRRIGLDAGPTEVVALAAGFDAMLDRLKDAADTQRRLVEEASHELRVPLAVLTTNAEVLLAHPNPTVATCREGLERSRRAAERLSATLDELLVDARGRARTIDRRPADLMAIVGGIRDEVEVLAASKAVTLTVTGPPALECAVDEPTVRRAVANLVDNAVRYAPEGSTVEVDVDDSPTDVVVAVTDHGPGIPAAEHERVLEPFRRGTDDGAGTGLGLAIARQVAVAHGGSLTVGSPGPAGDGTVLRLALRHDARPPAAAVEE